MSRKELTQKIKELALEIGFDKVGIAPAKPTGEDEHLHLWLQKGYHGAMEWMTRNIEKRLDPTVLLPGAKSVIALAMNYFSGHTNSTDPGIGRISRYAWGDDYHDLLKKRMNAMLAEIKSWNSNVSGRCFVDTAPIMDKYWAVQAGIGWLGKHGVVITRDLGSWVFLGEIVLNIALEYDTALENKCGSCRRCLDVCPTGAIIEPYQVDATRCISYWTIEHQSRINPEIGAQMGNHIFGCDDCQDVCPWNIKFAKITGKSEFQPRKGNLRPTLNSLAKLTEDQFRVRYRKSPVKRSKFSGFQRNIALAKKNLPESTL